jgi:SNF2 family DNA or RNA helicase
VHHIVAVNTIDQRIIKVLETKGDMQQALLDAVNELKGKA